MRLDIGRIERVCSGNVNPTLALGSDDCRQHYPTARGKIGVHPSQAAHNWSLSRLEIRRIAVSLPEPMENGFWLVTMALPYYRRQCDVVLEIPADSRQMFNY